MYEKQNSFVLQNVYDMIAHEYDSRFGSIFTAEQAPSLE